MGGDRLLNQHYPSKEKEKKSNKKIYFLLVHFMIVWLELDAELMKKLEWQ